MAVKTAHHLIIYAHLEQFESGRREVPMVYLANGKPGYVINQWIFYLVDGSIKPSRLDSYVGSLCMLYDYGGPGFLGHENEVNIVFKEVVNGKR